MTTASKQKTPKAKPPRLTVADVKRYLELQDRRLDLTRQARAIADEQSTIADAMMAHARAAGGSITKGGHTIQIVTKPGSVAWKKEFIRACGSEAATRLTQQAPERETIKVD